MYVTDATHMLDDKGAIGPKDGPGLEMAEATGSIIQSASLSEGEICQGTCLSCHQPANCKLQPSDEIHWSCPSCGQSGMIYNWRTTLWDLSQTGTSN